MACHPCQGHACDHCWLCELGICCMSANQSGAASNSTGHDTGTLSDLREALTEDAHAGRTASRLRNLAATDSHWRRLAALHAATPLALPPGRPDPLITHLASAQSEAARHRKEQDQ